MLKRAVREQQRLFDARVVLIEDKASGTQLIQELIADGCHGVTRYQLLGPPCLSRFFNGVFDRPRTW